MRCSISIHTEKLHFHKVFYQMMSLNDMTPRDCSLPYGMWELPPSAERCLGTITREDAGPLSRSLSTFKRLHCQQGCVHMRIPGLRTLSRGQEQAAANVTGPLSTSPSGAPYLCGHCCHQFGIWLPGVNPSSYSANPYLLYEGLVQKECNQNKICVTLGTQISHELVFSSYKVRRDSQNCYRGSVS